MASRTAAAPVEPSPAPARVMTALGRGIPLTLLCDLWDPPSSLGLLESEREDPWLERLAYEAVTGVPMTRLLRTSAGWGASPRPDPG